MPEVRLVWTAVADVGDRVDLGASRLGHRFAVPILGGRFYGGRGFDELSGGILPGGSDRQLLRPDGIKELDAVYEMRVKDGTIISVRNRVIVDETCRPERYAMSILSAAVEDGHFGWLNRRILIGTLQSARPQRQAVIVRTWLPGIPTS